MRESTGRALFNEEKEILHREITEYSMEPTVIHCSHEILHINEAASEFFGMEKEQIIGRNVVDVFTEDFRSFIRDRIKKGEEQGRIGELVETTVYRGDGSVVEVELFCHPIKYEETKAIQSILRDMTAQKEAERELIKVMTPIVPLKEGVAVVPLIGTINRTRTEHMIQQICEEIPRHRLHYLIIDVSGLYDVDEHAGKLLYELTGVLKLLGIQPICTGIRPDMVRNTLKFLNRDGKGLIPTMASVSSALSKIAF
ncbi:PAS domain S-box protein [Halobacillus litoralis]|uniref:PAS domain S-box protein n=1 Tax=Halobacillus litoralis TaxID=45668 RepID=A0A845DYD5_9BACI|nr:MULTISPECIES: PAS domain S-box protein [Halobacillus]MYL21455.1 PAS domain S-box protein [Halobacillus litoralis]MYL30089.1 PAS domain S-box protein [Halobacillus halophilus]